MATEAMQLTTGRRIAQVEIDEHFQPAPTYRRHQFDQLGEIIAWLNDESLLGEYVHRERKIRFNRHESIYYTNEEEIFERYQHAQVTFPVVGYRHRFSFTDPNTAFAFKMKFGGPLLTLG